jgi:hypothetical protein
MIVIVRELKSWWQKNNKIIKQAYEEDYFVY